MEPFDDFYFEEVGDDIFSDYTDDEDLQRYNEFRNIFEQMAIERKENLLEIGMPPATSPDIDDRRLTSLAENASMNWEPRSGIS